MRFCDWFALIVALRCCTACPRLWLQLAWVGRVAVPVGLSAVLSTWSVCSIWPGVIVWPHIQHLAPMGGFVPVRGGLRAHPCFGDLPPFTQLEQ